MYDSFCRSSRLVLGGFSVVVSLVVVVVCGRSDIVVAGNLVVVVTINSADFVVDGFVAAVVVVKCFFFLNKHFLKYHIDSSQFLFYIYNY